MNKSLMMGLVGGAVAATGIGAAASFGHLGFGSNYAEVVSAKPVSTTVSTPRQVCHDEQITEQKPVKDEHRIAGTAVGAVLGGLLGNQIGGGNGKKLATVAGAAAGGYAGNQVQDKLQRANTETKTEQRCETVYDRTEKPAGFRVTYTLNGKTSIVHMDHDPGSRIPLKDGKPVTKEPESSAS